VCERVAEVFGGKYVVLLIEDPEVSEEEMSADAAKKERVRLACKGLRVGVQCCWWGAGEARALVGRLPGRSWAQQPRTQPVLGSSSWAPAPRHHRLPSHPPPPTCLAHPPPQVAFQLTPAVLMEPPQSALWQYGVAVVLGALLLGSCGQLALVANVSKLPKETLEFFANPDNLNSNLLPPGLDTWDPAPYLLSALPIAVSNVRLLPRRRPWPAFWPATASWPCCVQPGERVEAAPGGDDGCGRGCGACPPAAGLQEPERGRRCRLGCRLGC
jgi:hypothetical protein